MKLSKSSQGIVYILMACLLFGSTTPISKVFLDRVSPLILVGLMTSGAGLGLAVISLITNKNPSFEDNLKNKDWLWFGAATLMGGVIAPILLILGIEHSPASSASLLLSLEGVFTALIAWTIFRERFDRRIALGIAAIIAGSIVLSTSKPSEFGVSWGALAVMGASLSWATDNNLTRHISHRNSLQIATLKSVVSGIVNMAIALYFGGKLPDFPLLVLIGSIGLLNYGVSMVLFVLALRHIGASRTGAFFSLTPFVGAAIAIIILGEKMTLPIIVAGGLMLIGVGLCINE